MPFLPQDSGRVRATGTRATCTSQVRPSAWVTTTSLPSAEGVGAEAHSESRWVSPSAARTCDSAHWAAGASGRPAAVVERAEQLGRRVTGEARLEHPGRALLVEPGIRLAPRQQHGGRGEAMAAGVRDLPHPAGRHPRRGGGERPPAHGAAHVAPAVGAHEQGRLGVAGSRQRRGDERTAAAGERAPVETEQLAGVGDLGLEQPRRRVGGRAGMGEQHPPGPVVRGVATGTAHEHEAAAGAARAGVELGPEQRVEVRLAGRVAAPRARLLDDDEEAGSRGRAVGARAVGVPLHRAGVVSRRAVPVVDGCSSSTSVLVGRG